MSEAVAIEQEEGVRLQAQGLTKRYGQREVLRHLQLSIEPGQFIAIVGRSGCGKSTLLRLVAGLEQASEGQLLADGKPIDGLNVDRQARVCLSAAFHTRRGCALVRDERQRMRDAQRQQHFLGLLHHHR